MRHDSEHIYSQDELDKGQTHDDLWNAAQLQVRPTVPAGWSPLPGSFGPPHLSSR